MTANAATHPALRMKRASGLDAWALRVATVLLLALLVVGLVLPLATMLVKSFQDQRGAFAGLANYAVYFDTPALVGSIYNSFFIAAVTTAITMLLAFLYAFALSRTCMPGKAVFRTVAMIPLLAPSLLAALSLIYMFGNQGFMKGFLFGHSIYGPIGIVIGLVFAIFPHAFIILNVALSLSDRRLYEAAESLGASRLRTFLSVTLPGVKYGLVSTGIVCFTLAITDFGTPKVIGGNFDVLATDVYKQVIGLQNFEMGAVVSVMLLLPASIACVIDRLAQRRLVAMLSTKIAPYEPKPSPVADGLAFVYCGLIAFAILGIIGVAAFGSFVKFWPYDLSFTLRNYNFDLYAGGGWKAYANSLKLSLWVAVVGTAIIFFGAYLIEKTQELRAPRRAAQVLAILPMGVPGIVLGLSYIFFFNAPGNPLNFIYGTMAILVISTIIHYYTVTHLTAMTALKQLDAEFEAVSDSLKSPRLRTFWRVTVPICTPALLDISVYFFLNAMTTVSAVVFLYSVHTNLASISILNMDDAGEYAPAVAMSMVIVITCVAARLLHALLTHGIHRRSQAWRRQ
jgi:iron(III) transport system permease protein